MQSLTYYFSSKQLIQLPFHGLKRPSYLEQAKLDSLEYYNRYVYSDPSGYAGKTLLKLCGCNNNVRLIQPTPPAASAIHNQAPRSVGEHFQPFSFLNQGKIILLIIEPNTYLLYNFLCKILCIINVHINDITRRQRC